MDAGVIYVYDAATGNLRLTIPNPEPSVDDEFGGAIALVNGDILVGASGDELDGVRHVGSAYLFDGWTGQLLMTLRSPSDTPSFYFGNAVAATDEFLILGAPGTLPTSNVFVFEGMPARVPGDTNRDGVVDIHDLNHVRNDFGSEGYGMHGDLDRDGVVNIDDLNAVRNNFGLSADVLSVPEPNALALGIIAACVGCVSMRSVRCRSGARTTTGGTRNVGSTKGRSEKLQVEILGLTRH